MIFDSLQMGVDVATTRVVDTKANVVARVCQELSNLGGQGGSTVLAHVGMKNTRDKTKAAVSTRS